MIRRHTSLVLVALLTPACQSARTAEQDRAQALEQRVVELEKQLAQAPSPVPAATPSPEAEPASARPRPPAVAARPSPPAARPAPAATPAPAASAAAEPRPVPAAEPRRPEPVVIPAGTSLALVLETPLSSARNQEGDSVTARVERAVSEEGRVVLPGGVVVRGRVVEAKASGRVSGKARLSVRFDRITVRGVEHEIDMSPVIVEAEDSHDRDAKVIGGGAAAGALIGAITGGKKGLGKGILVGGAAGTGAVLATKGKEVELPAGSRWTVRVREAVRL